MISRPHVGSAVHDHGVRSDHGYLCTRYLMKWALLGKRSKDLCISFPSFGAPAIVTVVHFIEFLNALE